MPWRCMPSPLSSTTPKKIPLGVKVLWAPILLVHLGGQDCITAYNIEDNEMWKRHVLTAMSQVAVAVYVLSKSWPQAKSERYQAAAILLFIPGILKCILKPWALKRVSINSLVDPSASEETDGINSLEVFIQKANNNAASAEGSEQVKLEKPYDLFVDLTPPYSLRLRRLKHLVHDPGRAHRLVQSGLSATFDRLYTTKGSVLHLQDFSLRKVTIQLS